MKRFLLMFIYILMSFSLIACDNDFSAVPDNTPEVDIDNTHNENDMVQHQENPASDFEYTFNSTKEAVAITKYIGKSKNIVIPREIEGCPVISLRSTQIGDNEWAGAFENTAIETVVIPETVRYIGSNAFKDCASLSSVVIMPDSELMLIYRSAFLNCTSLESINLENAKSLIHIFETAFFNCTSLEKIQFPNSLMELSMEAFGKCSSLKSVNIPKDLDIFAPDSSKFYDVHALEEIVFEDGRESINGYHCFWITSTVNVTVPQSVKVIDIFTFCGPGTINMTFSGDCPEFIDSSMSLQCFQGDLTIYYDPNTKGWDTTPVREFFTLIPY